MENEAEIVEKTVEVVIQSDMATAGVFIAVTIFLFFFEDLFKFRGVVRFLVAGLLAYLFREYWYILMLKITAVLEIFGLVAVE